MPAIDQELFLLTIKISQLFISPFSLTIFKLSRSKNKMHITIFFYFLSSNQIKLKIQQLHITLGSSQ